MACINISPLQLIQYKGNLVNAWDLSNDYVATAETAFGGIYLLKDFLLSFP